MMKPHQLIDTASRANLVNVTIAHQAVHMAEKAASPQQVVLADGDQQVAVLSPDAHLVRDASNCIVLVTPGRRITVTNVAAWREALSTAHTSQQICADDAGQSRAQDATRRQQQRYAAERALYRSGPERWRSLDRRERAGVVARLIAGYNSSATQLSFAEYAGHWAAGFHREVD